MEEPISPPRHRSIPACAGEPSRNCRSALRWMVYPRVCGGTRRAYGQTTVGAGLSPRVRGNPPLPRPRLRLLRSIPACAGEPKWSKDAEYQEAVYPRVCGGTRSVPRLRSEDEGLSPRVRGNRPRHGPPQWSPGSIPACAGEPTTSWAPSVESWVYPRVCGGTSIAWVNPVTEAGLSPRVRGNRLFHFYLSSSGGSIPACAGEPDGGAHIAAAPQVYPRVCGGTQQKLPVCASLDGLSPRVRGNPSSRRSSPAGSRSIPACAGEPGIPMRRPISRTVYPRVCGGTGDMLNARRQLGGLSPRVRGNRRNSWTSANSAGSIPACAGEPPVRKPSTRLKPVYPRVCGGTADTKTGQRTTSVYPRVCGGTYHLCNRAGPAGGLSPRVRGNPDPHLALRCVTRSIPACAGEPLRLMWISTLPRVYPRVCGGTPRIDALHHHAEGLSPRVRGNQCWNLGGAHIQGSIPACAGEPS